MNFKSLGDQGVIYLRDGFAILCLSFACEAARRKNAERQKYNPTTAKYY